MSCPGCNTSAGGWRMESKDVCNPCCVVGLVKGSALSLSSVAWGIGGIKSMSWCTRQSFFIFFVVVCSCLYNPIEEPTVLAMMWTMLDWVYVYCYAVIWSGNLPSCHKMFGNTCSGTSVVLIGYCHNCWIF